MFAFVGYQLWGTGLEYAQAQNRLDGEFEELLASANGVPSTAIGATASMPGQGSGTTASPPTGTPLGTTLPIIEAGDAIARIEIPSIGLDATVVAGVTADDLKKGPGHYPDTPMPGQLGNAAIAGHRTTYGQPFFRLDEIAIGQEMIITTPQGRFVFRMTGREVVGASAGQVLATTDPTVARLTLTTCHPRYSAAERLVVHGDLDVLVSTPPQAAVLDYGRPPADDATRDGAGAAQPTAPVDAGASVGDAASALSHGWFSDDRAFAQIALWGTLLSATAIWSTRLSRRAHRNSVGALAGAVPFLVALYFLFQNVNRLLPAAL
jgi:sortase A